ncbi:hypothetical protein Q0M94_26575 (plasmid) [Deinococcus radiomollis]|uniref:hypothetical protein n=1 Tax=Deinococcus radiomollis TaxID=468916 RepID=UPI003891655D
MDHAVTAQDTLLIPPDQDDEKFHKQEEYQLNKLELSPLLRQKRQLNSAPARLEAALPKLLLRHPAKTT